MWVDTAVDTLLGYLGWVLAIVVKLSALFNNHF